MRRFLLPLAASSLALLAACKATPPSKWAQGGAMLDIPRARWALVDNAIDLMPDGTIFINSEHVLSIDRAGRVVNPHKEPVALLTPDGHVLGPSDTDLGVVGALHASLPDEPNAWLSVLPTGEVIRYGDEGERMNFGAWLGCNSSPRTQQTCTLVSHILGMKIKEEYDRARALNDQYYRSGLAPIGPGLGLSFP